MPDEWVFAPDAPDSACTREEIDGAWAVRVDLRGYGDKEQASVMLAQHDVPMVEGQWYRISLKARSEGMEGKRVTLAIQDTQVWQAFFEYQYIAPTDEWREFRFIVQSKSAAPDHTRLQIWHANIGTLWLRDVAIEPIPPPSEGRWAQGLYLDQVEAWDDPYRFFRW